MQHEDLHLAAVEGRERLADEIAEELYGTLLGRHLAQQAVLHCGNKLQDDVLLQVEARLVEGVGQHRQHILQQGEVILLEEGGVDLRRPREQPLQEQRKDLQATAGHLRLPMLQRPDQGVDIQL